MNLKIWYFISKPNPCLLFEKLKKKILYYLKKFTLKFKQKISFSKKISKKEINFLFYLFKKLKKNSHCEIKKIYIQKGNLFPLLLFKKLKKNSHFKKNIQKGNQFPFLLF